jgi:ubiquinone/menaquinone biosynthesis C-methylase UbiE
VTGPPAPDHYSYSYYADPATAQAFDACRFGGPIGELVAETQARVLADFIGAVDRQQVLDVGTGTGRAALWLAKSGACVTAVDASEAMLAVARQRAAAERVDVRFQVGDAHALDFPDRTFDVVVCLRVLMHTPGWRRSIAELCRVAERLVVLDYPSATSFALLESMSRRMLYTVGWKTEPYRVFTDRAMARAFDDCGFRIRSVYRQFVLPIALHRAIASPSFTRAVESMLDRTRLSQILGSPVSIVAQRCASS